MKVRCRGYEGRLISLVSYEMRADSLCKRNAFYLHTIEIKVDDYANIKLESVKDSEIEVICEDSIGRKDYL